MLILETSFCSLVESVSHCLLRCPHQLLSLSEEWLSLGKGEDWEHSWPDCKQRFPVLSTSHWVQTARSSQDYPVLYHVTRSSSDPLPHLFLVYDKLVVSSEERLRAGFHGRIFGRRCLCRQGVLSTQQMIHDVPSKHKREINSKKFKIRWKPVAFKSSWFFRNPFLTWYLQLLFIFFWWSSLSLGSYFSKLSGFDQVQLNFGQRF